MCTQTQQNIEMTRSTYAVFTRLSEVHEISAVHNRCYGFTGVYEGDDLPS